MTKKRKSEASALNEIDRPIYSSFSTAASGLSQLYSQSVNQHKLAFQAGEKHALEQLYSWMMTKEREGAGVSATDVCVYLQSFPRGSEAMTEIGSQNEKNFASPILQEYSERQKGAANLVCPLASEMDIS